MIFSRICECYICNTEELTNRAIIPDGWVVTWDYSYTLCGECYNNLSSRMEVPLWMIGGEEEIKL